MVKAWQQGKSKIIRHKKPNAPNLTTQVLLNAGDHTKGTLADCTGIHQDCSQGRDATHKDDADGTAGFSFTKLDKTVTHLPMTQQLGRV